MRHFLQGVLVTLSVAAAVMAIIWFIALPRFDWGANQDPGVVEEGLANDSLRRWVRSHTDSSTNPLVPTAENLKAAGAEYEEHCAACHGLDGSGSNRFEAHFYPPVPRLTGDAQKFSDAEIYFIIANGIAYTAMPAFGKNHSANDIWRLVLWVRHLGNLSPQEKVDITREMQSEGESHEKTMSHSLK